MQSQVEVRAAPIHVNPSETSMAPTTEQINRACNLYSAGADALTFAASFAGETDDEGLWLLWHAAKAALAIDQRHPFTSKHRQFTTSNGTQVIVR